jgi:hypothetical protein
MSTVTIGGNNFNAYLDESEIDEYAAAAIGDNADAWRDAEDDVKARAAVSATRLIDRLTWLGAKTASDQTNEFPRTSLTYADGSAVPSDTVPQRLLDADAELAMALVNDADVQDAPSTAATMKRVKAGSAEVEWFASAQDSGFRFPQIVHELIGAWLTTAAVSSMGAAFGVDEKSKLRRGSGLTGGF